MPAMTSIATPIAGFQCLMMIARRSNKWTFGSGLNNPPVFRPCALGAASEDDVPPVESVGVRPRGANILVSGGRHPRQLRGRRGRDVAARRELVGIVPTWPQLVAEHRYHYGGCRRNAHDRSEQGAFRRLQHFAWGEG